MLAVKYGTQKIQFNHTIDNALKHAYITVDFYDGVILKTPAIDEIKAKETVYKKGKWILDKLKLVERIPPGKIATGSRLLYLGRRYYVDLMQHWHKQYHHDRYSTLGSQHRIVRL